MIARLFGPVGVFVMSTTSVTWNGCPLIVCVVVAVNCAVVVDVMLTWTMKLNLTPATVWTLMYEPSPFESTLRV